MRGAASSFCSRAALSGVYRGERLSFLSSLGQEFIVAVLAPFFNLRFNDWFEAVLQSLGFVAAPVLKVTLEVTFVRVEAGCGGHDG